MEGSSNIPTGLSSRSRYPLALILGVLVFGAGALAWAQEACWPGDRNGNHCLKYLGGKTNKDSNGDPHSWIHTFENGCTNPSAINIEWTEIKSGGAAWQKKLTLQKGTRTPKCNSENCDGGSIKWWPVRCPRSEYQEVSLGASDTGGDNPASTSLTAPEPKSKDPCASFIGTNEEFACNRNPENFLPGSQQARLPEDDEAKYDKLLIGNWIGTSEARFQTGEKITCREKFTMTKHRGPNQYVQSGHGNCRRTLAPGYVLNPGMRMSFSASYRSVCIRTGDELKCVDSKKIVAGKDLTHMFESEIPGSKIVGNQLIKNWTRSDGTEHHNIFDKQ